MVNIERDESDRARALEPQQDEDSGSEKDDFMDAEAWVPVSK